MSRMKVVLKAYGGGSTKHLSQRPPRKGCLLRGPSTLRRGREDQKISNQKQIAFRFSMDSKMASNIDGFRWLQTVDPICPMDSASRIVSLTSAPWSIRLEQPWQTKKGSLRTFLQTNDKCKAVCQCRCVDKTDKTEWANKSNHHHQIIS